MHACMHDGKQFCCRLPEFPCIPPWVCAWTMVTVTLDGGSSLTVRTADDLVHPAGSLIIIMYSFQAGQQTEQIASAPTLRVTRSHVTLLLLCRCCWLVRCVELCGLGDHHEHGGGRLLGEGRTVVAGPEDAGACVRYCRAAGVTFSVLTVR